MRNIAYNPGANTDMSESGALLSRRDFVYYHSEIEFVEYSNGFFPGDTESASIYTATITQHASQ